MPEILIAGLGSVGRRHYANLRALGWGDIRVYRTGLATLPSPDLDGVPVENDLSSALARRPAAVIVANPTACHLPVAVAAARAGAHLLIEKPISHDLYGVGALEEAVDSRRLAALVGFQFRFNPGLRQLRMWIRSGHIGKVVSAQAHWGECLPDMHPWEDFRGSYAARPELGGGVLLTLCHPFDYLRWLVGDIEGVYAAESQRDDLRVPVDTCVDVTLQFACGASGHINLNFVQRPPDHRIVIVGTEGTVAWSQSDNTARLYSAAATRWETVTQPDGFERNTMFVDEMRHFLACMRGEEKPVCTLGDGRAALEAVVAAKQALARARVLVPAC